MRLMLPLFALTLTLAACGEVATPPAQNAKPTPTAEQPKPDPAPAVNVEVPKDTPPKAGQTVAYIVEGMH